MKNRHRFISASILAMLVMLITQTNAYAQKTAAVHNQRPCH